MSGPARAARPPVLGRIFAFGSNNVVIRTLIRPTCVPEGDEAQKAVAGALRSVWRRHWAGLLISVDGSAGTLAPDINAEDIRCARKSA